MTEELAKGIDAAARLAADTAVGTVQQELLRVSLDSQQSLGAASGGSVLVHALAEALAALPRLADERDQEQVEGITRMAQVLQVSIVGGWDWAGQGGGAAMVACMFAD